MKKILFFTLAACLIPAALQASGSLFRDGDAFVTAKAVKLGRENSSAFEGLSVIDNSGGNSTVEEGKDCDPNCDSNSCNKSTGKCSKCTSGRYLFDNLCLTCPTGASCDDGKTFKCTGLRIASGRECKASCSGVSCKSGYSAVLNGTQCCCEATSCPSGQRLSGGKCVSNCTGVSCKSGYKTVSTSTGCCCQADTVSACPANCQTCTSAGVCTACKSGYTLSGGQCTLNAITACTLLGCQTCNADGTACTKCMSGWNLVSGKCQQNCPTGKRWDPVSNLCVDMTLSSDCPANTQDCGSTGCCPTSNSCSYYANMAKNGGMYMCFIKNYMDTPSVTMPY